MDYEIRPTPIEGYADATGIYLDRYNRAWLGENDGMMVHLYQDSSGDYIPAPNNWKDLIIRELELPF